MLNVHGSAPDYVMDDEDSDRDEGESDNCDEYAVVAEDGHDSEVSERYGGVEQEDHDFIASVFALRLLCDRVFGVVDGV